MRRVVWIWALLLGLASVPIADVDVAVSALTVSIWDESEAATPTGDTVPPDGSVVVQQNGDTSGDPDGIIDGEGSLKKLSGADGLGEPGGIRGILEELGLLVQILPVWLY
jgi:hypothetical protein